MNYRVSEVCEIFYDPTSCSLCGECVDICADSVLCIIDEEIVVCADDCTVCGSCEDVCEESAIELVFRGCSI